MDQICAIAELGARRTPTAAKGGKGKGRGRQHGDGTLGPRPREGDEGELVAIAELGARRAHKAGHRSHEHMKDVRSAKERKRHQAELLAEKIKSEVLTSTLQLARVAFPGLSSDVLVGLPSSKLTPVTKATMAESLAMRSPVKQDGAANVAQVRAAAVVAATALSLQRQSVRDCLFGEGEHARQVGAVGSAKVAMVVWQHDETKQHLRLHVKQQLQGTMVPHTQMAVDVMVGSGRILCWDGDTISYDEPCIARCLELYGGNADFICSGMLRQMPVDVSDLDQMLEMTANHDELLFGWGMDRASANYAALAWFFDFIHHRLPLNVIPHVEPCGTHGVSLAKGRAGGLKEVSQGINGWSRLNRMSKTMSSLYDAVNAHVTATCVVVDGPPPEDVAALRKAISSVLVPRLPLATFACLSKLSTK